MGSVRYPSGYATGFDVHPIVGCVIAENYLDSVGVNPLRYWQAFVKLTLRPKTLPYQLEAKLTEYAHKNFYVN